MKSMLLTLCALIFSGQLMAAQPNAATVIPLPETAQEQGWDIRLVGLHYHEATNQTEFFYRVRIEEGAAQVSSWHLKLKQQFAGLVLLNSNNKQLHWHQDLQPGTEHLVHFKVRGERTTTPSNYTVQSGDLLAEGSIDAPSLEPLASAPMTASYP